MSAGAESTYFNRHLLRSGLQCPTKLYYKAHNYPEDVRIRPFLEHAGFNKHQLKKLAGRSYPHSVRVSEDTIQAAARCTRQLMQRQQVVIREAVFLHDRAYAKVPVLVKEGPEIELIDIHTKAFHPGKHRLTTHQGTLLEKWKPYIIDLAYKQWVARQGRPGARFRTTLWLPDKTARAGRDNLLRLLQQHDTDLDEGHLMCRIDATPHVQAILAGQLNEPPFEHQPFTEQLQRLMRCYFDGQWRPPRVGKKCGSCEFRIAEAQVEQGDPSGFINCWRAAEQVPEYTERAEPVLDLIGPGVGGWLQRDIYLQRHVPLEELPRPAVIQRPDHSITQKQRQSLQVRKARGEEVPPEIVKQPIFGELGRWEYPLHFLDFEAGNYAVPVRAGRRPYHLVLFQFSCHTLHEDGQLTHHQWLGDGSAEYPNYAMVRQLQLVPAITEGTIVQYSNFEHYALKTVRKELRREPERVPDARALIRWLGDLVERHDSNHSHPPYLADLSRLVKSYYYNRHMENSLSIKDVLKSVMTTSQTLKQRYSKPYSSTNFEEVCWWQWDARREMVHSPYQILRTMQGNEGIGRGTEAMVEYGKLLTGTVPEAERQAVIKALLRYCELDTLAMVMIVQHWKSLA